MKYCSRCGSPNEENTRFCQKCGSELNESQNINTNNENKTVIKKEGLATASLVIGIISLIFSFVFNILILPLAIIGLVLGIVNKCKKGKKISGIVLNVISIVVSISVFIIILIVSSSLYNFSTSDKGQNFLNRLYNILDYSTSDNYVSGTWNCKSFSGSGESNDYIVTMELNRDYSFVWNKYGDKQNNHISGTYTFEDEEKINNSGDYRYFIINSEINEFVLNGIKQNITEKNNLQYEFGITAIEGKKQGILINTSTYNMYYCYKQ